MIMKCQLKKYLIIYYLKQSSLSMSSHQIETQAFKESFERFLELDDCAIFGDIMHYDYYDFE